jgi:hypothetical protein
LKTPEKQQRSCVFRAIDAGDEKQSAGFNLPEALTSLLCDVIFYRFS